MYRYTVGTPCPPPASAFSSHPYYDYTRPSSRYAPDYTADDTTANLEYTTELKSNLRQAKPRRPARSMRKSAFNPALDIFEDVAQEEAQQQQQHPKTDVKEKRPSRASIMPRSLRTQRSTILAHPAQKLPKSAHRVQEPQIDTAHRRRVSHAPADRQAHDLNATVQLREEVLERKELRNKGPQKDPRRRTIYVPSDDTTVVTIHPGQSTHAARNPREKSPDIGLDLVTLSEEEGSNLIPALKKEKRAPRKSLAVPPKRGPLSTTSRSLQSVSFSSDVTGSGGGKENVPPGMEVVQSKGNGTHHIEINFSKTETLKPISKVHFKAPREPDRVQQSRRLRPAATQKRMRPHNNHDDPPAKAIKARADGTASTASSRASLHTTIKTERAKMAKAKHMPPASSSPFHTDKSPPTALRRQRTSNAPPEISMMHIVGKRPENLHNYPVLKEDLTQPELYEDNWLTYQEVAITQLLNSVFDAPIVEPGREQSPEMTRQKMLTLYHDPMMPSLHKRLQASLQYGALSIPKDLLSQTLRLKDDVGQRKKFLNLWTRTYNLNALRSAAETIIGRQITTPCRLSTSSTSSDDGSRTFRAERRAIEGFLDTFLIRNEDAVRVKSGVGSIASITRADEEFGSHAWSWRRTALRSLMLALLLDRAKTTNILPDCLFQTSSPHKTSVEVLHQLSNMLLPSLGDITRPLGHLTYKVEHVQYPLQEYTYHIDNIAIDLRDGITLTRLVELLLFSPCTLAEYQDETVTITMPTGELLTSSCDLAQKDSWVLSQHLKYPAIGRPQKVYNVQIALAALSSAPGLPCQVIKGLRAEDIVDGHREKTLSLLWSLVGKCGLGKLVDWVQLVKETQRFRRQWYSNRDHFEGRALDSDDEETTIELDGLAYHKRLLLSWSRSIARMHELRISNFTTSFSDPKALEVIVDAYLPSSLSYAMKDSNSGLAIKLKAIGCSSSFVSLFTTQHGAVRTIPSRDFTLLTLSFLASRLIPLSLTHRAASTIQSAYRKHLARRQTRQRIALLKLAHGCAIVAQARLQLVYAATSLQRRWRAVLDARDLRLKSDVLAFQALARGWAIRRWVRRITAGRIGGKEKARRVRGGW